MRQCYTKANKAETRQPVRLSTARCAGRALSPRPSALARPSFAMEDGSGIWQEVVSMGAGAVRALLLGVIVTIVTTGIVAGQTPARPPIGGVGSPPDAMLFYVAHGAADTCGPGCSDWIAAEGTVQFDTNRRLIATLDRQAGRKLPLVIHAWGQSNLNTATKLGRILRDRGVDASAGATDVDAC